MTNLLLVGCGKMGGALLSRWQKDYSVHVIEPSSAQPSWHKNLEALPATVFPDVIVFAVKPQNLAEILPAYKNRFGDKPLYLSIAAGKTTAFFKNYLGDSAQIIRVMPNTPTMVGKGMSIMYGAKNVTKENRELATQLMQAVGKAEWTQDESQMDAVTALSGSGPAYVFLFLDALTKAGVSAGLPESLAKNLAVETMTGSCALAQNNAENFEQLRKNVTSPGGTTEAALHVLMKNDAFETLIKEAVLAAKERSEALAE